jgi:molybdopterin converting factor small subunit
MRITFFGKLRERVAGSVELDVPDDVNNVAELRGWLAERYPDAADELLQPANRACVSDEIVGESFPVGQCALVEFFPPLSGG